VSEKSWVRDYREVKINKMAEKAQGCWFKMREEEKKYKDKLYKYGL